MTTIKRTAITLVAILIILVVGLFIFLSSNLSSLIVDTVESYGPKITQSQVTLKGADLSISGEGELNGLTVGNPAGYKSEQAFALDAIKIAIEPESLTADRIHIKSIQIESPKLSYEPGGTAGSNLQQLVKNVQQFADRQGGAEKTSAGEPEKKLIIDLLTIRDGEVTVVTLLSDAPIRTPLPNIEIRDIGKKEGGSSVAEVVKLVMQKVTSAASKVGNVSLDELKTTLQSQASDKLKGIQEKGTSVGGVGNKAGEVGDKLKSIFK